MVRKNSKCNNLISAASVLELAGFEPGSPAKEIINLAVLDVLGKAGDEESPHSFLVIVVVMATVGLLLIIILKRGVRSKGRSNWSHQVGRTNRRWGCNRRRISISIVIRIVIVIILLLLLLEEELHIGEWRECSQSCAGRCHHLWGQNPPEVLTFSVSFFFHS
jgi:heme/copper-type cytochrome/quinol oxidase subunit 2